MNLKKEAGSPCEILIIVSILILCCTQNTTVNPCFYLEGVLYIWNSPYALTAWHTSYKLISSLSTRLRNLVGIITQLKRLLFCSDNGTKIYIKSIYTGIILYLIKGRIIYFYVFVCKCTESHTHLHAISIYHSHFEFWFLFASSDTELDLGVQYQIITLTECTYLQHMKNQYG